MTFTYSDMMSMFTEYLPDAPVANVDLFITSFLAAQEEALKKHELENPIEAYARVYDNDGTKAAQKWLVAFAAQHEPVLMNLPDKKIQAIKMLREATYCSLKDGKEAVESEEVIAASHAWYLQTQELKEEWKP